MLYLSQNLIITEPQLRKLIQSVSADNRRQLENTLSSILQENAKSAETPKLLGTDTRNAAIKMLKEGDNESSRINDPDFINDLERVSSTIPMLREMLKVAHDQAQKSLGSAADKLCRTLLSSARRIQREDIQQGLKLDADRRNEQGIREMARERSLIQKINSASESCDSP